MEVVTARTVLCVIAAAGVATWIISLWNIAAARRGRGDRRRYSQRSGDPELGGQTVVGSVEVDGEPSSLLESLVTVLATGSLAGLSLVSIVDRGDDDVVFEIQGWGGRGDGGVGPPVKGRVAFRRSSTGRTRAEYQAYVESRGGLLLGAAIVQVLGLAALVGGFWALWTFVAASENPQVRLQVLQMLQAVHLLWPPFLLVFLHRRFGRLLDGTLKTTLRNLPYLNS